MYVLVFRVFGHYRRGVAAVCYKPISISKVVWIRANPDECKCANVGWNPA